MSTHTEAVHTDHYTYRVSWSAEDGEFVATCLELPSLSWLASTQVKALSGLRRLVDSVRSNNRPCGEVSQGRVRAIRRSVVGLAR